MKVRGYNPFIYGYTPNGNGSGLPVAPKGGTGESKGRDGMNVDCPLCGSAVKDVNPTLGEGWDHCGSCRAKIVDSKLQDDFTACAHCFKPLTDATMVGIYNMPGGSYHRPGMFKVFECQQCFGFSRHHANTSENTQTRGEKPVIQGRKEVK